MRECVILLLLFSNIFRFESEVPDRSRLETMGTSQLATVDGLVVFADNKRRQLVMTATDSLLWFAGTFHIDYERLTEKDDNAKTLNHFWCLVMNIKPVDQTQMVVMLGEDKENELYLLRLRVHNKTDVIDLDVRSNSIPWPKGDAYAMSLAINSSGELTCLVLLFDTFCYDTLSLNRTRYKNLDLWEPTDSTIGRSMIFLKDQRAFLVAYRYDLWKEVELPYLYVANFSDPSQPVPLGMVPLSPEYPWESLIPQTLDDPTMTISVHEDSKTMIIGMPFIDTVYILSFEDILPKVIFTHISPEKNIEFGQSVAMLDGKSYAVLARLLPTLPWALSRMQVNDTYTSRLRFPHVLSRFILLSSVKPILNCSFPFQTTNKRCTGSIKTD